MQYVTPKNANRPLNKNLIFTLGLNGRGLTGMTELRVVRSAMVKSSAQPLLPTKRNRNPENVFTSARQKFKSDTIKKPSNAGMLLTHVPVPRRRSTPTNITQIGISTKILKKIHNVEYRAHRLSLASHYLS
jgi:hypothetical protein